MRCKSVLALFPLLLLTSCRGVNKREISAGTLVKKDDTSHVLAEAKTLYDLGEIDSAIASLRMFVDGNAYSPSHDQAYVLIVEWLLQLKREQEARRVASYFMAHHSTSPSVLRIIELFDKADTQPLKDTLPESQKPSDTDDQERGDYFHKMAS